MRSLGGAPELLQAYVKQATTFLIDILTGASITACWVQERVFVGGKFDFQPD